MSEAFKLASQFSVDHFEKLKREKQEKHEKMEHDLTDQIKDAFYNQFKDSDWSYEFLGHLTETKQGNKIGLVIVVDGYEYEIAVKKVK